MRILEALADAISAYNGSKDPQNRLYQLRNPGGLKRFYNWQPADEDGYRSYGSFSSGYQALLKDLQIKCSGASRSGLTDESPTLELLRVFGFKDETFRYVAKHIRLATGKQVEEYTPISFFLQDEE